MQPSEKQTSPLRSPAPFAPQRIVVKVGTSTLTDAQGRIDRAFIADLTAQLAALRTQGRDVLLVSSGAIRAGRQALGASQSRPTQQTKPNATSPLASLPDTLPFKQAAAAIGQGLLMHTYTEAFAWRNVDCAQILLTGDDLSDRRRFLNARQTLTALLELGVVPVINENDTVAVEEIKFGDNDRLAALVATLVEADLLLILSDVEGLYAAPPQEGESGKPEDKRTRRQENNAASRNSKFEVENRELISLVEEIDETIALLAGGSASGVGTGGMRTKIEAARIAAASGIRTVIARGRRERVVTDVVAGASLGTTFLPRPDSDRLSARKRWIGYTARPRGSVTVNAKARERLLQNGVSLLAAGIVSVSGPFISGDLVEIRDESGNIFARGLANYADSEIRRVLGLRSEQFEEILGYCGCDEIIHRDNLVIEL